MANERNKSALEFKTMLRRHLKSGGAPVTACAGFDFDIASAYLEGALVELHRSGYESHLAGCATCRCHLIELSRLAQSAPHTAPQPTVITDQAPAWANWRESASAWVKFSNWKLNWRVMSAAGATFAIILAALGVHTFRQGTHTSEIAGVVPVNQTAVLPQLTLPTPSPDAMAFSGDSTIANVNPAMASADRIAQSKTPVPTPIVGPSVNNQLVPFGLSNESSKLNQSPQSGQILFDFNQKQETAAGAQRIRNYFQQGQQAQVSRQDASQQVADNANRYPAADVNRDAREQREQAPGSGVQFTPPSAINPMNTEPPKPEPPKLQPEKATSRRARVAEIVSRLNPFKDPMDDATKTLVDAVKPEAKPEANKEKPAPKAADDESSKPMKHRIRDKVFVFQRDVNMWFDQDYKEAMMKFRVVPLKRGSKDYEDVLAKEPQLKEFFDHGPIIVVWKNKIYKVK